MEGGKGLTLLAGRINATIQRAIHVPEFAAHANALGQALAQVGAATKAAWSTGEPTDALANAVPYLQAFGHTVLAWIWLDVALAAHAAPESHRTHRAPGRHALLLPLRAAQDRRLAAGGEQPRPDLCGAARRGLLMLHHIVMWKIKDLGAEGDKAANVAQAKALLEACASLVPGIDTLRGGHRPARSGGHLRSGAQQQHSPIAQRSRPTRHTRRTWRSSRSCARWCWNATAWTTRTERRRRCPPQPVPHARAASTPQQGDTHDHAPSTNSSTSKARPPSSPAARAAWACRWPMRWAKPAPAW